MTGQPEPQVLRRDDGETIAYHRLAGRRPTVVFLGGLMSDMTGTKALHLEGFARARGQAFVRFDYFGHGASSGAFTDGTIGRWAEDAVAVVDALTEGPLVLVGSSMGGWAMLLTALARPARVAALVGIAAAPDFTENLMWDGFDEAVRETLRRDGLYHMPSDYGEEPYPISLGLIEDGRRHLLLRGPIAIACPVRLLHGMADADVPYGTSLRLAERLESRDVTVTLVKAGDHRLSAPDDLARLSATVAGLLDGL
jgi:pimeloyl-ACP methyl ester carboxylesterase